MDKYEKIRRSYLLSDEMRKMMATQTAEDAETAIENVVVPGIRAYTDLLCEIVNAGADGDMPLLAVALEKMLAVVKGRMAARECSAETELYEFFSRCVDGIGMLVPRRWTE